MSRCGVDTFLLRCYTANTMSQVVPDEILTILARDARTSPETIATLTARPVADIRTAIAAYEQQDIIKRYKTIVDWEKAGVDKVFAFIDVRVLPAREVGFNAVAERIYRYPEVHSVWLISGAADLRLLVEGVDMQGIGRFVAEKLAAIDGVTSTDTHFIMRRYKEDQVTYAEAEADARLVVAP
jgi:DNA-binding Lrp family transcriptional regulator